MSGLAAVFHRDGRAMDGRSLDRMLEAGAHRGPDRERSVAAVAALGTLGRASMASCAGVSVAFAGRLDGRDDLRRALSGRAHPFPLGSDAQLALAAYTAWPEDAFARMLGDFAAVVWDETRQQLLCARDVVGVRPLYYYCDERMFVCGSELRQICAAVPLSLEPNEGMVAEHLCLRVTHPAETLHRRIFRVPPAHVLTVTRDRVSVRRYYEPSPALSVLYRSDEEYAEHFRALLADAIRCRVEDDAPYAAYLSGGLDSSSIVCLLESLRRQGALQAGPMETISIVTPGVPGNEAPYVRDVAAQWDLRSHEIPAVADGPQTFIDQVRLYADPPERATVSASTPALALARELGCATMLTGLGGDDWLCAYGWHVPELVTRGRLGEFFDVLRWENGLEFRTSLFKSAILRGLWPWLPGPMQTAFNVARGRDPHPVPSHLTPEFSRATAAAERIAPRHARTCATRTRQEFQDWFQDGTLSHGLELDDRHHAAHGLEARHPFHDRRVIEFLLAIPEEQRWRSTETKFVLRAAVGPLLPESVRRRTSKGDYSHLFIQSLERCGGETAFTSMEIARRGWVEEGVLREAYRRTRAAFGRGDASFANDTLRLWTAYGLELWLRHALP